MTHQPSQPTTDLADFTRRMMSNIDGSQDAEIAALKAKIARAHIALELAKAGFHALRDVGLQNGCDPHRQLQNVESALAALKEG